ncbi:hypothetical protein ACHAXS_000971, partial [Conticribra weissflogii]
MDMSCDFCGIASSNMGKMIDAVTDFFTVNGRRSSNKPKKFRHTAVTEDNYQHAHQLLQVNEITNFSLDKNKIEGDAATKLHETIEEAPPPALATSLFESVHPSNSIESISPAFETDCPSANCNEHYDMTDAQSLHSIPSLFSSEVDDEYDEVKGGSFHGDYNSQFHTTSQKSSREDPTDTVIAWSFLAAVLASPAPSSVMNNDDILASNNKKRDIVNLWEDEAASSFHISNESSQGKLDKHETGNSQNGMSSTSSSKISDGVFPIITKYRETDTQSLHSVPSLFSSEVDEENDEEKRGSFHGDYNSQFHTTSQKSSKEDPTDTVIAWSVLAAVLASPAPSSILNDDDILASNKKRKEVVNLWEDEAASCFHISKESSQKGVDKHEPDTYSQN